MIGTCMAAKTYGCIRLYFKGIYCQSAEFCMILFKIKIKQGEEHNFDTVWRLKHIRSVCVLALPSKVIMRECFVSASCSEC